MPVTLKTYDQAFNAAVEEILSQVDLKHVKVGEANHFMCYVLNDAIFIEYFRIKQKSVESFGKAFEYQLNINWPEQRFTFYNLDLNRADDQGFFNLWFVGNEYSMSMESKKSSHDSYDVNIFVKQLEGQPYDPKKSS